MKRSGAARKLWREVYGPLSDDKPGLFGQATSRAEAQVVRLSLLYALLDKAKAIEEQHLSAALALMDYASHSARHIFSGTQQDPKVNRILEALRERPEGLTRSELSRLFTGHATRAELEMALGSLSEAGAAHMKEQPSGGRPTERWFHGPDAAKEAKYPPASASVTERES